jgi:hypothetical protein
LLPTGSAQQAAPGGKVFAASDAVSAASATVADLRGFCGRQPGACTVGAQVATAIGYKAQAGAKMLYDFLNEALAPRETGGISAGAAHHDDAGRLATDRVLPDKAPQDTLTQADLVTPWRKPVPRRDGRHAV